MKSASIMRDEIEQQVTERCGINLTVSHKCSAGALGAGALMGTGNEYLDFGKDLASSWGARGGF